MITMGQTLDREKIKAGIVRLLLLVILFEFVMMAVSRNQIDTMTRSGSDGMTYFNAARNLRKYHLLTHDRDGSMFEGLAEAQPTDTIAPGYPVFLWLLFSVFPETLTTVFASNLVLGLITLLIMWRILQRMNISPWISLVILFLFANFPTTVDMTTTCLTENLFIPLVLGSAYLCMQAMRRKQNLWYVVGSFFLLGLASTVRGQGFLFFPLWLMLLSSSGDNRKQWLHLLVLFFGTILVLYVPLWAWLWRQLGRFVLYPTAGDGPRVWGAMPYFIDMTWTNNLSLGQVQEYNRTVAPGEYYRWRSFGMLWRMWFDCWSEDLPHSWYLTHWALWLHVILVIPTLVLIPAFLRKYTTTELFLAAIPYLLTAACLVYHGLPRYVSASYPVLFCLAGRNAQILLEDGRQLLQRKKETGSGTKDRRKTGWKRVICMGITGVFSLVLLYSLCIFPWRVDAEQSAFRLKKYEGIDPQDIRESQMINRQVFDREEISVSNAVPEGAGRYRITWQDHAIIQLTELEKADPEAQGKVVTRVILDVEGGNIYDFSTIYWLKEGLETWSEDHVYSIPRSSSSFMGANRPDVFIDGDAEALLIVPALFRGNEIQVNQIVVEKYLY